MSSSDGHAATREFCFVAFVTAFRAGRLAVGATSQWSWPNIGSGSGAVGQRPVCCNQDDCDAITIVESLRRRGDKTQNTVIDYDAPCTACIQCSFYISFYFVLIKLTVPCNYLILAQQWFRLSSATQCRLYSIQRWCMMFILRVDWKWRTWNWRTRYISLEKRLHYNAACNSFQNNGRIQVTAAQ